MDITVYGPTPVYNNKTYRLEFDICASEGEKDFLLKMFKLKAMVKQQRGRLSLDELIKEIEQIG